MFKTIFGLAFEGIRRKKSQTLLIAVVLIISLAFAVMTISYSESIVATNSNYRFSTYGSWYGGFANADSADFEYLESTDWLESYGLTTCYGTAGNTGIGTIDDNFASFGVSMNSGHLPKKSGEIAMEADVLSSLGYGYNLGQDITLTVSLSAGDETVFVVRTYTLCGVISEYSDTWSSASTLNGAIITEEDAEDIYETALKMASAQDLELDSPVTSCYFAINTDGTGIKSEMTSYLYSVSKGTLTVNSAYVSNASDASINMIYVVMIFAVSLLAVVIVYILQMQSEIRKIVRLRSLGSTKGQALGLVMLETLIISVPSLIIGTLVGTAGLWALLRFSVYAGSVDVIVSIPMGVLAEMFVMWIVGILMVRLLTVQVALFTPLTGRMGMQVKKARNSRRLQKTAIIVLSAVFCTVVIYTIFTALPTVVAYQLRVADPSYLIDNIRGEITDEELDEIAEIPGITGAWGYTRVSADVSFGDVTAEDVTFYVVDETDGWDGAFNFSKIDLEAFHNGDCVMIIIPSTDTTSAVPVLGESLTVSLSGTDIITTTIGTVDNFKLLNGSGYNYCFWFNTYDIVCSKAFLQKMIDALPENLKIAYGVDSFASGDTAVFMHAYAFADSNATYLSTDSAVSRYVFYKGWGMSNWRERYATQLQSFSQTLILLFVAGAAIGVVTLIILSSTIRLETEREKKRYGILQAIGMSKRQRNLRLAGTALIRSLAALTIGWGVFILRLIVSYWSSIKAGATVWSVIESYMDNVILLSSPATIAFVNLAAFAVVFMICYVSKLGLNKYTLMEMLREDR